MHGSVHRSLKQYVTERAGEEKWDAVREAAGIQRVLYLPVKHYPAGEFTDAVDALSEMTGHSPAVIQRDFGKYFAPELFSTFEARVEEDWDALDAVEGLADLYPYVFDEDGDAEEVAVDVRRPAPGTVVVNHRSTHGLCPLLEGVIEGIGEEHGVEFDLDSDTPGPDPLRHREVTVRLLE